MKIVVLGGGISPERQVSLETSEAVLSALRENGHKAIFVDMFLGLDMVSEALFDAEDGLLGHLHRSISASVRELQDAYEAGGESSVGKGVLEICRLADFVFLALHGEDGEDGKIQGTLDLLGIPYNGSGTMGSAMAMDKAITRQIMGLCGISTAPLVSDPPCVVKLVHGGSSIGLQICDTDGELEDALSRIRGYKDEYIIERKLEGTEVSVGVLDGRPLPPIEAIPPKGRALDYEAKYTTGENAMTVICPARISAGLTGEVQELAVRIHKALRLSGYSRTDFIIDREGKIWGLEVNTLSGFTKTSFIPLAASRAGISFSRLCETLIAAGIRRSREQKKIIVSEMAIE